MNINQIKPGDSDVKLNDNITASRLRNGYFVLHYRAGSLLITRIGATFPEARDVLLARMAELACRLLTHHTELSKLTHQE